MDWGLVVPVKRLTAAKSRLTGLAPDERAALALAFATDTLTAATAVPSVASMVVVTPDRVVADRARSLGAVVVEDPPGCDLNDALRAGAGALRVIRPDLGVAVLVADLPGLLTADLASALDQASAHERAFVVDHAGQGTTMVSARQGVALDVWFGAASAELHAASGAVPLAGGLASLRADVDSQQDLVEVIAHGVGPATRAALRLPGAANDADLSARLLPHDR